MTSKEKLQQFYKAAEAAQQTNKFEALYQTMCTVFKVKSIHHSVKHYIETTINTKKIPGVFTMKGFAEAYKSCGSIRHFYANKEISEDILLPAFYFAYESGGQEYYMFFESGRVLGPHHDSMWNEYFDTVYNRCKPDVQNALNVFQSIYGLSTFTYIQFEKLQRILREQYGVHSDRDFYKNMVSKASGTADFIAALRACCLDDDENEVCKLSDILGKGILYNLVSWFEDLM